MDIQGRKIEFIQEFLKIQNESIIERFEKLLKQENGTDMKKQSSLTTPMSVAELNGRIDISENDFTSGRYKISDELIAKYE